jgi:hypothetical protein
MHSALDAFAGGDYLSAARSFPSDSWQRYASLGLIGHPFDAARELQRFSHPDAFFFSGVASWIAGDDDRARDVLARCPGAHAHRLLELIVKRPITILAQLPWNRRGAWDILTRLKDPVFRILNVGFHPEDIQNTPYADVRTLIPAGVQPDFFVATMLEWHLIPPDVRTLGCPVIGHSSDFDLHIQAVAPWLDLFDELVVLDHVEWRLMRQLVRVPVTTFPKVFGVPADLPDLTERERDIDVFLSGTLTHPYHVDKDAIVIDVIAVPGIRAMMLQGFEGQDAYYGHLSRSKLCCTFIRHAGATPTRGIEALGMGCLVAVQDESVLRLFVPDQTGLVSYGPGSGSLASVIRDALGRSDDLLEEARRGAEFVRREFALERVASQYLRFLTFLAARPRVARAGPPPMQMLQKRPAVQTGWLPSNQFGGALLTDWASKSAIRIEEKLRFEESAGLLNDLARERLLAHYHDAPDGGGAAWLAGVVVPLERAIERFPSALVPRFNLVRVLVHFGDPAQVRQAIALLDDTLRASSSQWQVDPLEDVLPWDFHPSLFNYRRYFDAVTHSLGSASPSIETLIAVILASLNHYRSKYAAEIAGEYTDIEYAANAVRLDPEFAEYVLNYSWLLVSRAEPGQQHLAEAAAHLERLASRSARQLELLEIARALPEEVSGGWRDELAARAHRLWIATHYREHIMEPAPRRTIDGSQQRGADRPAALTMRQGRHDIPYLSIVLTGRNEVGNSHEQLFAAASFNHRLLTACGVDYELVFVEWRVPGRELLGDLLRTEVPEVAARLTTYEVDERYHAALSQNPQLQFLEFVAKNVGIRRAAGSYILVTNKDIYFSSDVVNLIARRMLRPMVVYRATRVDLRSHLDPTNVSESVLTDPRNRAMVNVLEPPFLTSSCGDFLLLDRFSFCALRGFNEVFRAASIHDSNFCYHAAAEGMAIVNTGMYIYHFGKGTLVAQTGADSGQQSAGAWFNRILYENPPSWGLGDSPLDRRGPGHARLEYDPAAIPPLVALRGIKSPAFVPDRFRV